MSWIALIVAVAVALFGVGFLFHTSHERTVLGKYNLRFFSFLLLWYLVFVPGSYLLVRFLLRTHEVVLRSGRRLAIRPHVKIGVFLILGLSGQVALETIWQQQLARRTLTRAGDQFHPFLQNTPHPDDASLHINRWGFRGDEIQRAKPPGTFRIFFFGGSTVICEQVAFEDTHCRVLEKELQAARPDLRVEVQNLGAEWHCSEHSLIKLLTWAPDFSPDLVLVMHGINDLIRSLPSDTYAAGEYRNDYGHYLGPTANLVRPQFIGRVLSQNAAGHWFSDFRYRQVRLLGPEGHGVDHLVTLFFPHATEIDVEHWPSLSAFDRNLRDFVEIAGRKQYGVLLATQPSLYRDDLTPAEQDTLVFSISQQFQGKCASVASMRRGMEQFNAKTRQIAASLGVPLVDIEAAVPKSLEYMYDDVHYTARGNALVGHIVAQRILASGLLPPRPSSDSKTRPTRDQASTRSAP